MNMLNMLFPDMDINTMMEDMKRFVRAAQEMNEIQKVMLNQNGLILQKLELMENAIEELQRLYHEQAESEYRDIETVCVIDELSKPDKYTGNLITELEDENHDG